MKQTRFQLVMPAELIQDLKTAARDKNISAGRYIKDAVKEALQKGKAGGCSR